MNSKIIIIAILIFIKVIGIASRARADFSYDEIKVMDWYKDYKEQLEKENRDREYNTKTITNRDREYNTKTITNIDDFSYTFEYLNGKKEYCIKNYFFELGCVDYSLIISPINYKTNKIFSNNPIYRCGNRKIYKDV